MDKIRLPMTVAKLQDSLSHDRLSKNKLYKGFITDTISENGKLELRWTHSDFTFMALILIATSEIEDGEFNDTIVYDLKEIVEIKTSCMNKTRTLTVKGLSIEDIKPMLINIFEVWSAQYAKIHSINKWNQASSQKTANHCIAIK